MAEAALNQTSYQSYDPSYFARLFAIEDRHFWFCARNQVISTIARQLADDLAEGYRVLEVGCGTGNVLRFLECACPRGTVIGMDLFGDGLRYARQRTSCALVQGDMHAAPFVAQFELIGLFDVLEHLPDDRRVLNDLAGMLAPGGVLLMTVPAHPSLWSYFDEASRHCRRYEPEELESKLRDSGYQVEYLTQYMASIFPLVWLGRRVASLLNRNRAGGAQDLAADELRIMPVINDLLTWLLTQETRLIARRRRLPVGASLLVIARRPI